MVHANSQPKKELRFLTCVLPTRLVLALMAPTFGYGVSEEGSVSVPQRSNGKEGEDGEAVEGHLIMTARLVPSRPL